MLVCPYDDTPLLNTVVNANNFAETAEKKSDGEIPPEGLGKDHSNPASARWRYLLAGLIGLALGLGFAAILWINGRRINPPSNPPNIDGPVYIVGSGTVHLYLKELDPKFAENLKKDENISVQILEGPTVTGAKMFSYAYDQGIFIEMASKSLELKSLQRFSGQPSAVFKAYIGDDPLQLHLVVEKKEGQNPKQTDSYIVQHALPDFTSTLTCERLGKIFAERDPKAYNIYVGPEEAGTSAEWKKLFAECNQPWPADIKAWESRSSQENEIIGKPKIFLGSRIQSNQVSNRLDHSRFVEKTVEMVNKDGVAITRGLYLYGLVGGKHSSGYGYDIQQPVADILRYVFKLLEKSGSLKPDCREEQRGYFNLNLDEKGSRLQGRVNADSSQGPIFQHPCAKRPKQ